LKEWAGFIPAPTGYEEDTAFFLERRRAARAFPASAASGLRTGTHLHLQQVQVWPRQLGKRISRIAVNIGSIPQPSLFRFLGISGKSFHTLSSIQLTNDIHKYIQLGIDLVFTSCNNEFAIYFTLPAENLQWCWKLNCINHKIPVFLRKENIHMPEPMEMDDLVRQLPDWAQAEAAKMFEQDPANQAEFAPIREHESDLLAALQQPENQKQFLNDPAGLLQKLNIPAPNFPQQNLSAGQILAGNQDQQPITLPDGQTIRPQVNIQFTKGGA
jgi:hypothetical protein